jgi:flavin reductase (DIM6/NTAB) family NADH-FMN oxidoreductase RutF
MRFDPSSPDYRVSLFNGIVAPRPIGWISTVDAAGVANLAPFSYFNGVSATPPMVMFACNAPEDRAEKDSLANVRASGEFCVNLAAYSLRTAMIASSASAAPHVDEFALTGLERLPCDLIGVPRVAAAPAALECKVIRIVDLPPERSADRACGVVFGRVVMVHVLDEYLDANGRFDALKAQPMARLGGFSYLRVTEVFEMQRPKPL